MSEKISWNILSLKPMADHIYQKLFSQKKRASVDSDWWAVGFSFAYFMGCIHQFIQGTYQFSPMQQFRFKDECVRVWSYADRLIIRLLLSILKSTFKYVIPVNCFHLAGPNGVKNALQYVQNVLATSRFNYAIRIDIKSYYASINHKILIEQINQNYSDPRLKHYLEDIITSAVDDGGNVFIPDQGIPRRSSLSPFFGALYLSPLDKAFIQRKGVVYARYMDDVIILCQTKRQYQHARKILFNILRQLKLKLSPRKTWMGALHKGFHFLGVFFDAAKLEGKNQSRVKIHPRSCARALDKVKSLCNDVVHPMKIQRYLLCWALWWSNCVKPLTLENLLQSWVEHSRERDNTLVWYGNGLLSFFQSRGRFIL